MNASGETLDGGEARGKARDISGDILSRQLNELFAYWRDLKGDRRMPAYDDVARGDIPHLTPYFVEFEVERDPERFRLRKVGSHVFGMIQRDSTGGYVDEVFSGEARERQLKALHDLVATRSPIRNRRRVYFAEHLRFLNYESLHLPFSSDGERVDRMISGLQFAFDDGRHLTSAPRSGQNPEND